MYEPMADVVKNVYPRDVAIQEIKPLLMAIVAVCYNDPVGYAGHAVIDCLNWINHGHGPWLEKLSVRKRLIGEDEDPDLTAAPESFRDANFGR